MLLLKGHSRIINSVERPNPILALALLGLVLMPWTLNPNPDRNVLVDALSATPPRRPDPIPEASLTRRGSLERLARVTNASAAIALLLSRADRAVAAYDDAFYGYAGSDRSMDAGGNSDNDNDNEEEGLRLAKPMGPSDNSKPSAPLEYLLPAARVGVYIYGTLSLVEELYRLQTEARGLESDDPRKPAVVSKARDTVSRIDALLISPPSFVRKGDPAVSRGDQYGNNPLPLVGEVSVAARKQRERTERAIEVGLAPRIFEVGELVGERQQWNRLQRAEQRREGASEIRRAFNIYTTNLNFRRTEYRWVGSQAEKSRRIRSDKLPTTTEVIRSDLDARDLYRNQVQTALEDATAEWVYQLKESGGGGGDSDALWKNLDTSELLELLQQARGSVDKWFGFVPERDVKLAIDAVQREQEQA